MTPNATAHESQSATFQFPIEFVEDDIRKDRGKRAPLGCPFDRWNASAIGQHDFRFQHLVDQFEESAIVDMLAQSSEQPLMVDAVEKLR